MNKIDLLLALKIFKFAMKLMNDYPHLLTKCPLVSVSEGDYLRLIWSRVFVWLFPVQNGNIRVKSGEFVFKFTSNQKQELYYECKNIKGFKIDHSFVVDINLGKYDLAAGEDSLTKTMGNESKIIREGKAIVDSLVCNLDTEYHRGAKSWMIQATGYSRMLSASIIQNNKYGYSPT